MRLYELVCIYGSFNAEQLCVIVEKIWHTIGESWSNVLVNIIDNNYDAADNENLFSFFKVPQKENNA